MSGIKTTPKRLLATSLLTLVGGFASITASDRFLTTARITDMERYEASHSFAREIVRQYEASDEFTKITRWGSKRAAEIYLKPRRNNNRYWGLPL